MSEHEPDPIREAVAAKVSPLAEWVNLKLTPPEVDPADPDPDTAEGTEEDPPAAIIRRSIEQGPRGKAITPPTKDSPDDWLRGKVSRSRIQSD